MTVEPASPPTGASPAQICEWALQTYGDRVAFAFSGAEDVVVIDLLARTGRPFQVFTLDTFRLHDETRAYLERVEDHYDLRIRRMAPSQDDLNELIAGDGYDGLYLSVEQRKRCCHVRKVAPLRRAVTKLGLSAWITGQRRDQADSRTGLTVVAPDPANGGLTKINPLAQWRHDDVWSWLREHSVPGNPLHDRGFASIGCAPCTRPIKPGDDLRAGRWWWEQGAAAECGIHTDKDQD